MELLNLHAFRQIRRSFNRLIVSLFFILLVLLSGTLGYMKLENLSFLDSAYFTISTLSTVGFGDYYPTTPEAKLFTIFLIVLGVSVFFYTITSVGTVIFEGKLLEVLKLEKLREEFKRMKEHTILCGYGDVGVPIAENVKDLIIIDGNEDAYTRAIKKGKMAIRGDSTTPEILYEAGIERAKSMVIALDNDPDVVFTILTAKELNPHIKIYARANKKESVNKMRWAGATDVVCLSDLGGQALMKALME